MAVHQQTLAPDNVDLVFEHLATTAVDTHIHQVALSCYGRGKRLADIKVPTLPPPEVLSEDKNGSTGSANRRASQGRGRSRRSKVNPNGLKEAQNNSESTDNASVGSTSSSQGSESIHNNNSNSNNNINTNSNNNSSHVASLHGNTTSTDKRSSPSRSTTTRLPTLNNNNPSSHSNISPSRSYHKPENLQENNYNSYNYKSKSPTKISSTSTNSSHSHPTHSSSSTSTNTTNTATNHKPTENNLDDYHTTTKTKTPLNPLLCEEDLSSTTTNTAANANNKDTNAGSGLESHLDSQEGWRLKPPCVCQLEGVPLEMDLILYDLLSAYAPISDWEKKTKRDTVSLRFKFGNGMQEVCDMIVADLDKSDFSHTGSVVRCFHLKK